MLASSALAAPTALKARQSDGATCGSHSYDSSAISGAVNAGFNYLEDGETVGNDNYPHQYKVRPE